MLGFRSCATMLGLALSAVLCGISGAQGVPIDAIEDIWERKQSTLIGCRISYESSHAFQREGKAPNVIVERRTLFVGDGRFRIEIIGPNSLGAFVPKGLISEDDSEYRMLSFDDDGLPSLGVIQASRQPQERVGSLAGGPLGHSGLISSHAFGLKREDGLPESPNWYDLLTLLRHPDAVIKEHIDASAGGEPAMLIELDPGGTRRLVYRVWLSTDRNLAMLRHDLVRADMDQETVMTRAENSDFTEVAEGLFLPRTSTFDNFGVPTKGILPSTLSLSNIKYELGVELADDVFRLSYPDGVQVEDHISEIEYVAGETASLEGQLDGVVADVQTTIEKTHEMERLAEPSEDLIEQPLPPKRVSRKFLYGIACATIVMFPFGFWLGRLSAAKGAKREIEEGVNR